MRLMVGEAEGGVARSRTVCRENRLLSLISRGVSAFTV